MDPDLAKQRIDAETLIRFRERIIGPLSKLPFLGSRRLVSEWRNGSPILLYHRVVHDLDQTNSPFAVRRNQFEQHVRELSARFKLMTVGDLINYQNIEGTDDRTAAITFDDGDESVFTYAIPILQKYGAPATFFVDTGRLGDPDVLSRENLQEMVSLGFEIGSHSVSHSDLRKLSSNRLEYELRESMSQLNAIINQEITGFAYPFGYYNERIVRMLEICGYEYACTCRQNRANNRGQPLFELGRIEVNLDDQRENFRKKLSGTYAPVYSAWYGLNEILSRFVRG